VSPAAAVAPRLGVRQRGFVVLAVAYGVSQLGSAVSLVALPIIVFRLTGSPVHTGLLGVIEVLPTLLLGLSAGTLADRIPGRLLPVATDVASAGAYAALAVLLAVTSPPVWAIYVAALVGSVSFVFHSAPFPAMARTLVGRPGIVRATSVLVLCDTIASVAGSALAAVLLTVAPMALAVGLDAASFLLSGLLILSIRLPRLPRLEVPGGPGGTGGTGRGGFADDMKNGVRFFWATRDLRNSILAGLGMVVTGGALLAMLTPFAVQGMGVAADGPAIGLLYAGGNIGSAVAAALLPMAHRRTTVGRVALYGLASNGVLFLVLLTMPSWQLALPFLVLWQLTYTLVIVNNGAIRQLVTPVRLLGRVSATARILAWGGAPVGAAVASGLSAFMSVRAALAWCGLGVALGIGWAVAGRVGSIDVGQAPDDASPADGDGPPADDVEAAAAPARVPAAGGR
jgi:hypothetical protein